MGKSRCRGGLGALLGVSVGRGEQLGVFGMKRGCDCWLEVPQTSKYFGGRRQFKLNNAGTKADGT